MKILIIVLLFYFATVYLAMAGYKALIENYLKENWFLSNYKPRIEKITFIEYVFIFCLPIFVILTSIVFNQEVKNLIDNKQYFKWNLKIEL